MADKQNYNKHQQSGGKKTEAGLAAAPASTDPRGLFDFGKKKDEEKPQGADLLNKTDFDEVHASGGTGGKGKEEKKQGDGLLDKIKDKLPAATQHDQKKTEEGLILEQSPEWETPEGEAEKKGFLDKIKDKIPGFNTKSEEEEEEIKLKEEKEKKEKEKKEKEEKEKKEKEKKEKEKKEKEKKEKEEKDKKGRA